MTTEEWKSIDEIARTTIRMHLAEKVYFSMAKETTTFLLWEKLEAVYEKKFSSSKLILFRQVFNMRMREPDSTTSHINTFSQVLSELSSQGINFAEEVKALALLSSLPASWQVFCMTFAKCCQKLNLDETIGQVVTENIQWKSMGITIGDSVEAHNSTESINRFNHSRKQAERTGRNSSRPRHWEDRHRSKSRNSRSSVFYTHCRKTGHDVSKWWLIKSKENSRWLRRNTGRSNSNRSPDDNKINVADSYVLRAWPNNIPLSPRYPPIASFQVGFTNDVAKIRRGYVNFEARPLGLRPKDIRIVRLSIKNSQK